MYTMIIIRSKLFGRESIINLTTFIKSFETRLQFTSVYHVTRELSKGVGRSEPKPIADRFLDGGINSVEFSI